MNQEFLAELEQSGYVHFPLPSHAERSLEAKLETKPALESRTIWRNGSFERWQALGRGSVTLVDDAYRGEKAIRLRLNNVYDSWPEGAPADGEYTGFGHVEARYDVGGEDWSGFNRISFWIKPDYASREMVTLVAALTNEGKGKVPDPYFREGFHIINLRNHQWNHILWEFPDLDRDRVTQLRFYTGAGGDLGCGTDHVQYDVAEIELQRVVETEYALGWQGAPGQILYSTAGYENKGRKTALFTGEAERFALLDAVAGKPVFHGDAAPATSGKGVFSLLDFSAFERPGRYLLEVNGVRSEEFPIEKHVLKSAIWKSINFLLCERCGAPVGDLHNGCHYDAIGHHEGRSIIYNGGWHDAADKSQQTLQTAEVAHALFEMAERTTDDPVLTARLLEEANWGLDFTLRTRFGDGWRLTSAGTARFTNNILGDMDDIITVRKGNRALENFLFAGIEADAARVLKRLNLPGRGQSSLETAVKDFAFAEEDFRARGLVLPEVSHEHTFSSGLSQFYAGASWAASMLYRATGKEEYAARARDFMDSLLACQETGEAGLPIRGMFYRDESHSALVHYTHQSREQLFVQAMLAIAETQPNHSDLPKWEGAMRLYAQYLKDLMPYSAPYGMIPSGVYQLSEAEDFELFRRTHHGSDYELEHQNFIEQVRSGTPIGQDYYVRCFPVWFSFRGNTAIHLASGKAAAQLGHYFGDRELIELAWEQAYWMFGKNPFGQSLMYGEGRNYAQQDSCAGGDVAGELPVGIESFGNTDLPYWPQGNNCTYKEVWTSSTSHFLWLAAELY